MILIGTCAKSVSPETRLAALSLDKLVESGCCVSHGVTRFVIQRADGLGFTVIEGQIVAHDVTLEQGRAIVERLDQQAAGRREH